MPVNTFAIFGSGEYGAAPPELSPGTFIIAADGRLSFLQRHGLSPDLIVGDFDSYAGALPEGVEIIRHPVMKDETDMELAVRMALARGAERVVLYGGLGGRLDHSFANIQLLALLARRNAACALVGKNETVTAVCGKAVHFPPNFRGTVSVFAYGGRAVVTETGLLYKLDRATLLDEKPLGVSNQFTGAAAEVTVHEGTAILMWESENRGFPRISEV